MCSCINRIVLIVVNVLFAILGGVLVGVSLWVILSQETLLNFVQYATANVNVDDATLSNYANAPSMLKAAAWVLLGFGGFSLLVGLCGCIGAATESSCLLIVYAVLVSIILIAEIAGAVVAAIFKVQIGNDLKPRLTWLEQNHYLPLEQSLNNKNVSGTLTSLVNYLQVSFQCCGINNSTDLMANTTRWSRANPMFRNQSQVVPVTCCPMQNNRGDLLSKQDWSNVANYLVDPNCPTTGNNYIQTGCYNTIDDMITRYTWILIIGGVVIGLCELVCVIMACALVQKIRSSEGRDL